MYSLRLLGPPQLQTPSGSVKLERRPAAVSAYLALEGSTPKYRLAGMLWPDSGETSARNNMRQMLRRMRVGGADIIEGEDFIGLRPEVNSDLAQLTALDLGRVLELGGTGELLEGYDYDDAPEFDEWLLSVKEELRELHLRATHTEAERLEEEGEYGRALELTQTSLRLEPLSEETYRRLMRLHYLQGDRAAALAAFERCKQVLTDELGAQPLPETWQLAREIEGGSSLPRAAKALTAVPLSMLRPPVLVGREAEWERLEAAWAAGQFIAIGSQGGQGKTRLMMDFIHSKVPPESVLYVQARPGDVLIPYSSNARSYQRMIEQFGLETELEPWVRRELSRIIPGLADPQSAPPGPLGTPEERLRFYQAKFQVTVAAAQRGMRVIASDDVHLTDPQSAEATVHTLGMMGTAGGMAAVYAYRQDELSPQLAAVIEGGAAAGLIAKIDLGPLTLDGMRALLEGLGLPEPQVLAPGLLRYTGGNPLFALETVRHLHQTGQLSHGWPGRLPSTGRVKELTQRRLQKLSKPALNLAQAAAVLQSDFGFELVCETLGASPLEMTEAWQELEAAQIMSGERFSHDLLFEAVQQSTPQAVQRWLHRAAAGALERQRANPARVARHWLDGNEALKAAPWLIQAAQAARSTYDLQKAADFYGQAAQIYRQNGQRDLDFASSLDRLEALFETEDQTGVDEALEQLSGLAATPRQKAQVLDAQARYHIARGQKTEGERAARAGLEWVRGRGERQLELNLLNHLGTVLWLENRLPEAEGAFREILELTQSLGQDSFIAEAHTNLAVILDHLERHPEALGHHLKAQDLWENLGNKPNLLTVLSNRAVSQSEMGLVREAVRTLEEAEVLAEETDERLRASMYVLGMMGVCHADLCHYGRALEYLRQAHLSATAQGSWHAGTLLKNLAWVYLDLGQHGLAQRYLEEALALPNQTPQTRGNMYLTQARLLRELGQPDNVALAEAEALITESGRKLALGQLWVQQSYTGEVALERSQQALRLAQEYQLGGLQVAAHTRCAAALLSQRQPQQALEHSQQAVGLLSTYDTTHFYRGEVLWTHYQALRTSGEASTGAHLESTWSWLNQTAEGQVPVEYRLSFMEHNTLNRVTSQARG